MTPIIDERALMDALDCRPTYEAVGRLQQAALASLVDCFDRDVTREAFIEACSVTANLIDSLARMALLHNVKQFADTHGSAAPDDIAKAQAGITQMVEQATQATIKIVDLMRQCPLDEDRIH